MISGFFGPFLERPFAFHCYKSNSMLSSFTFKILSLGFDTCTVLCLSVDFFEFILLGVCGVSWILTFISFTRFEMFSAILSILSFFGYTMHYAGTSPARD